MRLHLPLAAVLSVLAINPAWAQMASWTIDPAHSSANFTIKHMMISNVHGSFDKVAGTVVYDGKDVSKAKVDATIDPASINTGEPKRDDHLRNPDFFDVVKFPQMTFKSKRIVKGGGGKFKLIGDLTMHGVTKELTLNVEGPTKPVKDPRGKTRIGASATSSLKRKDFGLEWNKALETGGVMVGDEVRIALELELVKDEEKQPAKVR